MSLYYFTLSDPLTRSTLDACFDHDAAEPYFMLSLELEARLKANSPPAFSHFPTPQAAPH
jgi:hypothetical protein